MSRYSEKYSLKASYMAWMSREYPLNPHVAMWEWHSAAHDYSRACFPKVSQLLLPFPGYGTITISGPGNKLAQRRCRAKVNELLEKNVREDSDSTTILFNLGRIRP